MSSLSLLSEYASSDESDSESDDSGSPKPKSSRLENGSRNSVPQKQDKHKPTLPVPSEVLSLFKDRADPFAWQDDRDQHNGRVRTFAHEPGVWASYAFVSGSTQPELGQLISTVCADCPYLNPQDPNLCHVSLSRTVKLRHHWIQPIVDALRVKFAPVCHFSIFLGSLEVYTNEEKTRTFLGLKVHRGVEQLKRLVVEVDACLTEYELPLFYEDPSFHMSLAWCEAKHEHDLQETLHDLQFKLEEFASRRPLCRVLTVPSVWFRSGNKLFELPLVQA